MQPGDVQELGKLHVDYCFNCGSCTFICLAKRPLHPDDGPGKGVLPGEIKKEAISNGYEAYYSGLPHLRSEE